MRDPAHREPPGASVSGGPGPRAGSPIFGGGFLDPLWSDELADLDGIPGPRQPLVVVGAGRSGTSAITRGLQALGVELGDRLKGPTGKNPKGFFEDRDLLEVSKRVRRATGQRKGSVALVEPDVWRRADLAGLRQEAASIIRRRFGHARLWGFKYPDILRQLPFWEHVFEELGLDPGFVLAIRNPLSLARSRARLGTTHGVQEKSDLQWLVHVVPSFRRMARHPFVVVDYDLLMDDPERQLGRVASRLRLPLDEAARHGIRAYANDFLEPDLRHTRFALEDLATTPGVNPLVRDGYRWLHRLARDESTAADRELWRAWSRLETALADMSPLLRHLDCLEDELARRRLGPWSALYSAWAGLTRA